MAYIFDYFPELSNFLSLLAVLGTANFSNAVGTYYLFGGSIVAIITFAFVR
jgi:hypothetical protein